MFRTLLILLLSVSLLFSCSSKEKDKVRKGPSVIVDGKVKEGNWNEGDYVK